MKFRVTGSKFQIIILASLCLAFGGARGASAQGRARARAKGHGSVVVTERGRAHTLNLSKQIDAAHIEDASVLFLTRRGGFVYLVLTVCGLSRFPPGDRQCGAGIECNLVWLKLDGRWRALDSKSERYESCWAPITSEEGPKVVGKLLTLVYEDLRENLRHEVTYDDDSPERGLKSETRPLPEQNR
ncbi:MAG TPA: hypothetical protein VKB12_01285 [Pyrinomonadaceae bacterium]|nr:hypothetical protein [Pyrinomonadaceae bacterium]